MMTAAVTGANGHIGNNLCRELLNQGYKVKVLIRKDSDALKGLDLELIKGDVTDKESLQKLIEGADIVFHLAAIISINRKQKHLLPAINIEGTRNISEICLENNIKRLIHFSSVHALNQYPLDKPLTEENPLAGNDTYAYDRSKAEAEKIILKACDKGLNAIILNPTSVIGVNDYKPSLLGQAVLKIAKGKLPALIPGGFDWVDVRDVVQGAISAIEKGRAGERYLLSGHWRTLEDLTNEINKYSGRKNPIKTPTFLAKIGLPFINLYGKIKNEAPLYTNESLNILKYSNKNVSRLKASEELDYTAHPFSETIKDTFDWFKKNGMI